jgi:hypothetical protein
LQKAGASGSNRLPNAARTASTPISRAKLTTREWGRQKREARAVPGSAQPVQRLQR